MDLDDVGIALENVASTTTGRKPMSDTAKFILFIAALVVVLFFFGIITGLMIRSALTAIPIWAWAIIILVLLWRLGKR